MNRTFRAALMAGGVVAMAACASAIASDAEAKTVKVNLTAKETMVPIDKEGHKAIGWTYDGQIPGPVVRATEGDTIEFTLTNDPAYKNSHSFDFHTTQTKKQTTKKPNKPKKTKKNTFTAD